MLVRTDRGVVILLSHIDVFSTGCLFRVRISVHNRGQTSRADWFEFQDILLGRRSFHVTRRSGALPDELLRFGVSLADGSKATTTGAPLPHDRDTPPEGPVLVQHPGGGASCDRLITSTWPLWFWPLPPAEPFDPEQEAAERGVDQVRLDTWVFNNDALAFFQQVGYEPVRLQLRKSAADLGT